MSDRTGYGLSSGELGVTAASSLPLRWESRGDVLTSVLTSLGLEGSVFCHFELSAPWGLKLPARDFASFHVVDRGNCWLRMQGHPKPIPLSSGSLVVLPSGKGHSLTDAPGTRATHLDRILPAGWVDEPHVSLRHGGGGVETRLVCGIFRFARPQRHPLLAVLPALIHIDGNARQGGEWLSSMLETLVDEAGRQQPGAALVISRLTEVIFVHAVRAWMDSQPASRTGWLGALKDAHIGAALRLIHAHPERRWTVASLAAEGGLSRSPFSARFTSLVGRPPLTYLTWWRMQVATGWLLEARLGLAEIAYAVGYQSEAAFSKAFKHYYGTAPGAYRRAAATAFSQGTPSPPRAVRS